MSALFSIHRGRLHTTFVICSSQGGEDHLRGSPGWGEGRGEKREDSGQRLSGCKSCPFRTPKSLNKFHYLFLAKESFGC